MKRLSLMTVIVFVGLMAIAQEISAPNSAPVIVQSATPVMQAAPERIYTATEYEAVQKEAAQARNDFNALLQVYQQQRAERELILSAILQAVIGGNIAKAQELIQQIIMNQLQPRSGDPSER